MIGIIWRKTFWSIEEGVNARFAQHRHAVYGHFQDGFKMVEIFGQLVKFEICGNAVHRPWF